ncbi:hypothetical protein QR685DRAFT_528913 [Neurospora intermedia]|uniref:Uncharacterized protein n=1 Tax=Neurospora intermedia TaxID=5142 RepID=A0ABR3DAD3_NEUIN
MLAMAYIPPMRQRPLDKTDCQPPNRQAIFSALRPWRAWALGSNILSSSPWTTYQNSIQQQTKTYLHGRDKLIIKPLPTASKQVRNQNQRQEQNKTLSKGKMFTFLQQ